MKHCRRRRILRCLCQEYKPWCAILTTRSGIQIACFYETDIRLLRLVTADRTASAGDLWKEDARSISSALSQPLKRACVPNCIAFYTIIRWLQEMVRKQDCPAGMSHFNIPLIRLCFEKSFSVLSLHYIISVVITAIIWVVLRTFPFRTWRILQPRVVLALPISVIIRPYSLK